MSDTPYTWGACGAACHPDRYTVHATRVRLRRRWGVWDHHLDRALLKTRPSKGSATEWRDSLTRMEALERSDR